MKILVPFFSDEEAREKVYGFHRGVVRRLIREKERLSKASAKAYSVGQKATAHECSEQAEQLRVVIEEEKIKAAEAIFEHL